MATEARLAGHVRRILAVLVDGLLLAILGVALIVIAAALVPALNSGIGFIVWIGMFLLIDLTMTAVWGSSLGRLVTGIRVVQASGGRAPGILAALVRILVVIGKWMVRMVDLGRQFGGLQGNRIQRFAGSVLVGSRCENGSC